MLALEFILLCLVLVIMLIVGIAVLIASLVVIISFLSFIGYLLNNRDTRWVVVIFGMVLILIALYWR